MLPEEKFGKLRHILPDVSRETFERLLAYEALFHKWSKAFNLAAPSTLPEFWTRHILDSAQLASIRKPKGVWVDLGSGGGLPGIVMAVLLRESEGGLIHLVESNGKKSAFLRQALIETGGTGRVHSIRIEAAYSETGPANVVTARALAPFSMLLELARPWMNDGATALFHKGREYREEVMAAGDAGRIDLIEHGSTVDPGSTILEIRAKSVSTGD